MNQQRHYKAFTLKFHINFKSYLPGRRKEQIARHETCHEVGSE
jgi:hypothetical protein